MALLLQRNMEMNPEDDEPCQQIPAGVAVTVAVAPEVASTGGDQHADNDDLKQQGQQVAQHVLEDATAEDEDDDSLHQKKRALSEDDPDETGDSSSRAKRPRLESPVTDATATTAASSTSATASVSNNDNDSTGNSNSNSNRKKRRIRFLTDPADETLLATQIKTYEIDYSKEDIWWTKEEARAHCIRQSSMLEFYQNNLPDMVDSCLLVWVNCAEQALDDGNFCMTLEQRANVAEKIAHSPVRGFEKELAAELISEQRQKTIGGLLELQELCRANAQLPLDEKLDAMAAASEAFSQTASHFARTIGEADAKFARYL